MDALEKMRQWVQTFPLWEEGNLLYIDYTAATPGNTGLYPMGMEIVRRKEDVLGNVTCRCRYRFTLYRVVTGQEDNTQNAAWGMAFQNWVMEQSALGLAPVFGDEPQKETLRAEQGKLKNASQTGTGFYGVELTAEFVKKFEM